MDIIDQLAAIYEAILAISAGPTPPFEPDQIEGLVAWYKDTGIQHTGFVVDSWSDSSGNGNHLTPPGVTPAYAPANLNGHDVVEFGTDSGADGQPLTRGEQLFTGTGATIFLVAHKFSFFPNAGLYTGFGHTHHHPLASDSHPYDGGFSTVRKNCGVEVVPITDNWRIFCIRSTDGNYAMDIDGVNQFTTAANVYANGTDFVLGQGVFPDVGNAFAMQGWIAEVIVYHHFLTDIERDQVTDYLRTRFGL